MVTWSWCQVLYGASLCTVTIEKTCKLYIIGHSIDSIARVCEIRTVHSIAGVLLILLLPPILHNPRFIGISSPRSTCMLALMADTTILKLFYLNKECVLMPIWYRCQCQKGSVKVTFLHITIEHTRSVPSLFIPTEILLALKFCFPHQGCQYREAQDIVWQAIQLFCLLCPVVSHHLSFWNLPFAISADIVFNLLWQCVLLTRLFVCGEAFICYCQKYPKVVMG